MSSRSNGAAGILEEVFGSHTYLGTITGDGAAAKTNATTAVPFTIPAGARIELQGDVAFYYLPTPSCTADGQASTAVTVSSTNGVKIAAGDLAVECLRTVQTGVSVISVSGTFNVKVFQKI